MALPGQGGGTGHRRNGVRSKDIICLAPLPASEAGLEMRVMTTPGRRLARHLALGIVLWCTPLLGQQPAIGSTPDEPHWATLLERRWDLHVDRDLRNPVLSGAAPAAVFRRADRSRPVVFKPIVALGLETTTRGGWYPTSPKAGEVPSDVPNTRRELWSYRYKSPLGTRYFGGRPPPLEEGVITFDPGDGAFGFWISNDAFEDGGIYTQMALVAALNDRLRDQPYRAMIYPLKDADTGQLQPHQYVIGWSYLEDDDFQDVVTQVENVKLLPSDPPLPGILAPDTRVRTIATGFKSIEGPTWDRRNQVLYFSDIPAAHIMRYSQGKVGISNSNSRNANGMILDQHGRLLACEQQGRRITRSSPGGITMPVATHYQGRRLNSPNDLVLDAYGGIYFTDPRNGPRDDAELDSDAVYHVAPDGTIRRIITSLNRPTGIALSPDGRTLYVAEHDAHTVHRYGIITPDDITRGERVATVTKPGGMAVDMEGRLYVAGEEGIWVLDRNGKWMGIIETLEQPSNCTFGEPDNMTLFITGRTTLYSIETHVRGWQVHLDGGRRRR